MLAHLTSRPETSSKGSPRPFELQLAVSLENIATAVPNPEAMGRERGAAAHQIAPVHAAGSVAVAGGSRRARSQILHIEGPGKGGREGEECKAEHDVLHPGSSPFLPPDSDLAYRLVRPLATPEGQTRQANFVNRVAGITA